MLHVFKDVGYPPPLFFKFTVYIILTQTGIDNFLLVVLGDIGKSMPEFFKGAMRKDERLNMYLYLVECKL